jgi:sugar transferase EpsL
MTSFGKRVFDIAGGAALVAVTGPVMLGIALAIRVLDGKPVFFEQVRPGLHGKPFTCRKFRTMRAPAPGEDMLTTDADRTTALGRFLRRTSLDELPELLQVISGEMSLVGPRPLLMEYLPQYSPEHRRRHDVRPGITGLAQVSGRRSLTLSQRLDLDVRYVESHTLALDVKILLRTLLQPFRPGEIVGQSLEEVDDLGFLRKAPTS